ncbi:MAG: hypothetical protein M1823_003818 [Watsoniomyces obsoletus]|nr:MAG: hypothetical protein M1823_003818 [Watsoniomyces obsoletus]
MLLLPFYMADSNIFAVLTACDKSNLARDAFGLPENEHRYRYRKGPEIIAQEPLIDSREATPAPQVEETEGGSEYGDCILLRFNDDLKDPQKGWQFGTNPRVSDVLLGHRGTHGISGHHFHITITEQLRIELHDDSRYGTVVMHEGQGTNMILKADKRLLGFEPEAQERWNEILVYVPDKDGLAFRIEFPNHQEGGRNYRENLGTFLKHCRAAHPVLGALGLESTPTTAPISRQSRTPHKLPVLHDLGEIGRGQFGQVHKLIDLRGGQIYAAKMFRQVNASRPMNKVKNKRKLDEHEDVHRLKELNWWRAIRNEVDIMEWNPHVSEPMGIIGPFQGHS